ncbi:MAG: hypothetical protein LBN21_01135 [Treponema sp.]|jgi:DNA-binding transcriptional regulator YiaG|nr:hypothetical protein [Treponema sp.]
MKKKYESELLMVCHEMADDWHRAGKISDAEMQEYDRDCLVQEHKTPLKAGISRSKPIIPAFISPRH